MKTCDIAVGPALVERHARLFRGRRVDHGADFADLVGRKAAALGMLADQVLVRRTVDAIDLVVRDIGMDPLNLRAEVAEDRTGGLRRHLEVLAAELPGAGHLSLDYELGHVTSIALSAS